MRPLSAAPMVAVAALAAWPAVAAEPQLTPRNSVVAALVTRDAIRIDGTGCNVPASATLALPAGAADVRVNRPAVGARSASFDERLTGVSVSGTQVTFTAIADGDRICDPGEEPISPAARPWSADFEVEVGLRLRVGVVHLDLDQPRRVSAVRPREVRIGLAGAARRIRWKRFGGRKAVGFGTFRSLVPCAGGCSDNGTRLRVELTRPGRCPGRTLPGHEEEAVLYGKVAFVLRERLGILRPGREWMSKRVLCSTAGDRPVPIR